jgi:hypothetical protein
MLYATIITKMVTIRLIVARPIIQNGFESALLKSISIFFERDAFQKGKSEAQQKQHGTRQRVLGHERF